MKRIAIIFLALALVAFPAAAADQDRAAVRDAQTLPQTDRLPGVDLAEGISQITGTAVSPLLGVSVIGAWRYFDTPPAQRAQLPWFSQPYAWGAGLLLLALCFMKDVGGTVVPAIAKKPLDAAEVLESKMSALLACGAFVPFVAAEMALNAPDASSVASNIQMASMLGSGGFDLRFVTIPLAMIGFLVVWLACHAINVLILLSPFGLIDSALKTFKLFLLGLIVISASIAPWLGAAVSLLLIYIAWLVAPWAFRLTVFGTLFSFDVFLPWWSRRNALPTEPRAFLATPLEGVPVRTYGRLGRAENKTHFRYRPWLVLSERSVALPQGNLAMAKGLLYPSMLQVANDRRHRTLVILRPRYRSHTHTIASHFDILEVHESSIAKGFRALRTWLAETIGLGKSKLISFREKATS